MQCRQCTKPVKKIGDYVPPTCGKSECQEAEYKANAERAKPKARRLKPKEGALKADGTRWTNQPGGIQKLEIRDGKDDPWFNNELQFARLIVEIMSLKSIDEGAWIVMQEDLRKAMGLTESQVTSIFMRANDVVRKNRGQA